MNFGIVGAGIVGTALAVRLEEAGHKCLGVNTRSRFSYERFLNYLIKDHLPLEKLAAEAEVLFITTQDDMIRLVAEKLNEFPIIKPGQLWIHCSGSLPAQILRVKESLPVQYLSIHPLQAFASVENVLAILSGTHFGVEGDNVELGAEIVRDLGGTPHFISAAQKPLYHAGAVAASNYLVVLASAAVELFAEAGIQGDDALASLLPLMKGTICNLEKVGLPQALTGPIARGDVQVVRGHLEHMPAKLVDIYRDLGLKALELGIDKKGQQGLTYPQEILKAFGDLLNKNNQNHNHNISQ